MSELNLKLRIAATELAKRKLSLTVVAPETVRDQAFAQQLAFVEDKSRYISACCTRRAGKSTALVHRFLRTMLSHPGCFCPFIALTRESAKNILWQMLKTECDRFQIKAEFTESNLTMTLSNGSRLQLFGATMRNFIERLKGIKTPGAAVDECQEFGPHIESLIDDVLGPAILDYPDGWIAVTGTPGPVPNGFFFEVTESGRQGFSRHAWSLFDNPYVPGARAFVDDLKKKKAWADDNPTLLREYHGRWVLDIDALVVRFNADSNGFESPPHSDAGFDYIIGVDLGFDDADAIAVIGWSKRLESAYLVEEIVVRGQGVTELALTLDSLIKKYDPLKIVMDTGGLGKKIAEEMRRRFSLPIVAAEKSRKTEFVELLNDALRTKKFFAKSDSQFAQDAQRLKWDYQRSTPDRMVVDTGFHSDVIDAVLYAFRESLHWLYEADRPRAKPNTPEWYVEQEDEAIERLERELYDKQNESAWPQGWD